MKARRGDKRTGLGESSTRKEISPFPITFITLESLAVRPVQSTRTINKSSDNKI